MQYICASRLWRALTHTHTHTHVWRMNFHAKRRKATRTPSFVPIGSNRRRMAFCILYIRERYRCRSRLLRCTRTCSPMELMPIGTYYIHSTPMQGRGWQYCEEVNFSQVNARLSKKKKQRSYCETIPCSFDFHVKQFSMYRTAVGISGGRWTILRVPYEMHIWDR